MVDPKRVRILHSGTPIAGPVVYVMGRDFRVDDNWALLYAQQKAKELNAPLCVLVHFGENFIRATERQHSFFIEGLKEISTELESLRIPFFVTFGDWKKEVKKFVELHEVSLLVTDFSPLHEMRWWWDEVSHGLTIPIHEVDAHNIIPCWIASQKQEFGAHTFRRKVRGLYKDFAGKIPKVSIHPHAWGHSPKMCWPRGVDTYGCLAIDWEGIKSLCKSNDTIKPVTSFKAGPKAAEAILSKFIKERLGDYNENRNNPTVNVLSNLSPYIRFGHISTQRIAYEISKVRRDEASKTAFLEELIVRRELAENFCFYNNSYNTFEGLPKWAQETLNEHRRDPREFIYTRKQFEEGMTHDPLWNAAQMEMVKKGKMHGYMRMYWAKKILEWTKTPEEALEIALYLNDTYSLDGRDPSGYVGVLWSIGGVHDRAWAERAVFGKIRYMNYNGCKRKFDVDAYIATVGNL